MKLLAKFKFLISFFAAILIALIPPLYTEYKGSKERSNIYFTYETAEALGLQLLKENYLHMGSFDSLKMKFENLVKDEFQKNKYTVEMVMSQIKVQIPINIALSLLKKLHEPVINTIKNNCFSKFTVSNSSSEPISIEKLVISTDDAYPKPIWTIHYDFPCERNCSIKKSHSSSNGYVLGFQPTMLLPSKSKLEVFFLFPNKAFVKYNNSFVQVKVGNNSPITIKLQEKLIRDNLKLKINFALTILCIFFVILGMAYLFLNYRQNTS